MSKLYNIYSGLGGSFGGSNYKYTMEFDSQEKAENDAYRSAIEEYGSREGLHGIMDFDDCVDLALEEGDFDPNTSREDDEVLNYAQEVYISEIESWIDYYAIESDKDINTERLKEDGEYNEI